MTDLQSENEVSADYNDLGKAQRCVYNVMSLLLRFLLHFLLQLQHSSCPATLCCVRCVSTTEALFKPVQWLQQAAQPCSGHILKAGSQWSIAERLLLATLLHQTGSSNSSLSLSTSKSTGSCMVLILQDLVAPD